MMGTPLLNAKRIALFAILMLITNYCSAQYTWVKTGAAGNWSNPANWSPAGVPGTGNTVTFNGTGTANCNIDVPNLQIQSLTITAAYTGVITNLNNDITITAGFSQAGGTFNGGTGYIKVTGAWVLSGGTHNSTTDTLNVITGPFTVSGGTWNANGGTVYFQDDVACSIDFQVNGNITFCNLIYGGISGQTPSCGFYTFSTNNTLNVTCCFSNVGGSRLVYSNGTVNIRGCICTQHVGAAFSNIGNTQFIVNGTGTQTLYGWTNASAPCSTGSCITDDFGRGRIPNLRIEKSPTDTLKVEGIFNTTGNYTYVSGIISPKTNGVLAICGGSGAYTSINGPAHTISNMALCGGTITFNTTINVDSAAIWASSNPIVNATVVPAINATRNVVVASTGASGGGDAVLNVTGTGTQTMYCNALLGEGTLPEVRLNSTNNIVITRTAYPGFCTPKSASANYLSNAAIWTYNSGTISGDGIVCFNSSNGTNTINNTHTLPNISYHAPTGSAGSIKSPTGTLTARDTLFTNGNGQLLINGQTDVTGSVFAMNNGFGTGGTGTITIKGSGNASFSSSYFTLPQQNGTNGLLPNLTIDKTGGTLTLIDTLSVARNWLLLNGTVVGATGSNVFLHNNNFNLDMESGAGTMSFYDLTIVGLVTRTLTGSVGVNNRLVLNDGKIILGSYKFSMNSATPANLVRTTGYVVSENIPASGYGRFEWAIGSAAAGNTFTYPFASTAGTYIPFTFEVQTPGSAGGKLAVATYPTDWTILPNNLPYPTGVTNINNILGANNYARELDRYWVPEESGFTTNPTGTLTFTYRDTEWNLPQNNIVETRLQAHRWLPATTAWQLPNGTSSRNTTNNTVTIPGQNTFTPFTIVDPELPDLRISSNDTIVCLGNTVNFFDLNVPTPNTNLWIFPGATPATDTSTATNPTGITYTTTGCKTVILEASYAGGTLRDTFPCFITITNAPTVTVGDNDISCNGGANGKAWVTVSGGTAPYSYTWVGGAQTNTPDSVRTGLAAGPYTITVNDSAGCSLTVNTTITEPPALTLGFTPTNPTCNNGTNGSIVVNASGGTPFTAGAPYTYTWNPGSVTGSSPTGLASGRYKVTVTDANGCTISDSVDLVNPPSLGLTLAKTDVLCNGESTGVAWATATGGTGPGTYTYVWTPTGTPGATPDTTRNQPAGSVSVLVTDGNSCTVTGSITINQPTPITVLKGQTNLACNGIPTGKIWARASGGTSGYTYTWSTPPGTVTGPNGDTLTNLTAGVYYLTTTDANNCIKRDTFVLTQPTDIVVTTTHTNVACFGDSTATLTANPSGGPVAGSYTFEWRRGGQVVGTTQTITGQPAGTYTLIVGKTPVGCNDTTTVTVTQPTAPVGVTISSTPITCFNGNNGTLTANPTGGTPPYTYAWTLLPSTSQGNTQTINGLGAGTYVVVVTDDSSCTATDTITLTNPAQLGLTTGHVDASCFGVCDGVAWAVLSGGTGPFTYIWSNGASTDTIRNLCPGTYTVTATDANGCTVTGSETVGSPTAINITVTPTDASCFGSADGEATVSVSGGPSGTPAIDWQDGTGASVGTGTTVTGLPAGSYLAVVTIGACADTATFTIGQPTEIITTMTGVNVGCFGGSTGSVTVTHTGGPTGGTTTYDWQVDGAALNPVQTTATITGLVEGEYTVIVDIDGCLAFDTLTITENPALATSTGQVDITCFNGSDGEVSVTATGGTGNYTYRWTLLPGGTPIPFGNNQTVTGLSAGVYQVEVTDDSSCTILDTVTLVNPAALGLTMGSDSASCFGVCDGTAWVVVSGGTPAYTYIWNTGAATDTITGLCPDMYVVTVTDANGCSNIDSIEIFSPAEILLTVTPTDASCFGSADGEATVSVSGGPSGTPAIDWQDGTGASVGTGTTVTGLSAGTYLAVVTIGACSDTASFSIGQPTEIITTITGVNVGCFGGNTGSVTVTHTGGPTGGTTTYAWQVDGAALNPVQTTATITGLVEGEYTVIVDIDGCLAFDTIIITEPTQLTSTITGVDPDCNGGTVGSVVTVTPTGGTQPYGYAWTLDGNTLADTDSIVAGEGAGIYIVTITDGNGCTITDTDTLFDPPAIVITKDSLNVKCFGDANGKAWVTVSGGTPGTITPYTISWSNGLVIPPGDTIDNLLAGTYIVTVTDGRGCQATDTFRIAEPPALTVTMATDSVSCFGGNDGKVWATAQGGVGGYVYDWTPLVTPPATITGPDGDTVISVSSLIYTVTVTDDSSCITTNSITIPQPTAIVLTHDSLNVGCFGANTGKAWVTASGGSPGYTYQWNNGIPVGNGDTIIDLVAGTYEVTVTDGNGCQAFDTVIITQPAAPLTLVMDSTNVRCFGESNGKAWVTVTGGTPLFGSYNYSWNGGTPIGLQDTIINLPVGTYVVTVTDSNGCTAIDSVQITQPPLLTLTKDSINVLCFADSTGKAWVTIGGGVGVYNPVTWTGGGTTSGPLNDTLNNLAAGTYTATVTDTNGCTATATFVITQPAQLVLNMFSEDVACFGDSTGRAWVVVTGGTPGTPPYTYAWSGGTQAGAGDTIVGLPIGTYTVTVTDGNGCVDTNSITINQPTAPLTISMDSLNIACFGQTTGKAWATGSGGTGTYTFTWSPSATTSGALGDTIINLAAGVYHLTITDANGCTVEDSVNIVEPPLLVATIDSANITCFGDSTGRAWANVTGGTFPYTFAWSGGNAVSNGDTIIGLGAGPYILTVTDDRGCQAFDTVNITEPTELVLTMDSINVSCNGANDGVAWVTATGGTTPPYTYLWSSGTPTNATGDTIAGLSPGIYVVTVTDAFNCTRIDAVTIEEPNLLLGNIQWVNVRCFGESSGRAWVTASGGNGGYTYAWSGGNPTNATGDTVTGLSAGNYIFTITDARGCTFIDSVDITEPAQLVSTMDSIDVLCFGQNTGSAWITVTGGLLDYEYDWSGGTPVGDGDTVKNLLAGTYTVTVTDDTGCILIDTVVINQPATPITLVKDSVNILCFGDSTGKAWVNASGGTLAPGSSYTYTWSRGTIVNDTATNLTFGIVRVTVTDDNGCEAIATFNITQPNQLLSATTGQNVKCFGENTGKAWVTASGGVPTYTYQWSSGTPTGAGDTVVNLIAGTYRVTVTDGNGCIKIDSIVITEPAAPLGISLDTLSVLCFGGNSGRAWATVTGGTTPYVNYDWSAGIPVGGGDTTINLTAGLVSVTVTDFNGCTISDSITVTEPATPLSIVMDSIDISCFSACDGQAWVTASGGTSGYTYVWANSTNTTDTLFNLCPGNYVVTVTDANGCRAIDLVSVNEPDELLLTINVDSTAYCNANGHGQITVSLTGGTGPYDYVWSNGDSTIATATTSNTITNVNAGQYTVTVTDANGCSTVATTTVVERDGPSVTVVDVTPTICNEPNGVIVLTVTTNDPTLDYDWSHDPLLNSPTATNLETGTYTVTITDASTCDTVLSIFVPAIDQPVVDSVIVKDSYCSNEDGVASVQVSSGTPPYTFAWSHDTSLVTNTATDLSEGIYSVTVTDANGCDTTLSISIVEIDAPELEVIQPTAPQTIYSGQEVAIEVGLVSPIDSVYYTWLDFPGLDCYDCTNPIATPERSTTYLVTVTDVFTGCQDTAYITVVVRDETNIFIPNAITPNGDGVNDVWVIRELETFPDNEVIVLNRWGDVVFSANPYNNDWDGTYNGTPLPAGTYYYIIKLDNISESVTGPITIVK